jgi:hypothetical protein
MKIGLSLSRCIYDIVAGTVNEADVVVIITNTCARDEVVFERLVQSYSMSAWRTMKPEVCHMVAWRLYRAGKIIQPRVDDPEYWHYAPDAWVNLIGHRGPTKPICIDEHDPFAAPTTMVCVDPGPRHTKWKRLPIEGGENL